MDRVELGKASFFPQDENHSVVAKATTGVDWDGGGLVHHEHFPVVNQNLQGPADHRGLVAVNRVSQVVVILWMVRHR